MPPVEARTVEKMTRRQYLEMERTAELKHEFFNGECWAMSGGTLRHSAISTNILARLRELTRNGPCRPFNGDARIFVRETGLYAYPDVSVVCGGPKSPADDPYSIENPTVLVEVLSHSTERFDTSDKAEHYRALHSLTDLVFVSQREMYVRHYHRTAADTWTLRSITEGTIELGAIGASLKLDEIYEGYLDLHGDPPRPRATTDPPATE